MIRNPEIVEAFKRQYKVSPRDKKWYLKADSLYETAMSLNPASVKQGGEQHLKMLIRVRKKMNIAKSNISAE